MTEWCHHILCKLILLSSVSILLLYQPNHNCMHAWLLNFVLIPLALAKTPQSNLFQLRELSGPLYLVATYWRQ